MTSEAPLNTHIIRGLQDKLYDKRKAAALEVDRYPLCYVLMV